MISVLYNRSLNKIIVFYRHFTVKYRNGVKISADKEGMNMPDSVQFTKIITDDSLMETVSHGSISYPFKYYYEHMALFDFNCIDWHWHSEFEFVYVESGSVTVDVGTDSFVVDAGTGIMINSRALHRFTSSEDAVIPNFLFMPSFIAPEDSLIYEKYVAPVISSSSEYIVFKPDASWQADVLDVIKNIIEFQNEEDNELEISIMVQKLWFKIFKNQTFEVSEDKATALQRTRLQLMMQYIHSHFAGDVSLDEIAAAASISKSTALHLFQTNLRITPVNYLILYRLRQAARMLGSTEKKVTAIALETGFNNVDYFCRSFKKAYGITPTDYRRS